MVKVTIHAFQDVDATGKHIVAAFPSVGLVATIVATYLVEELGLKQVGVMDSERFPTFSVVEDGQPMSPVRIYAGDNDLVVFLSEFQPAPELTRPVSEAIIKWAKEHKAAMVVAPEGLIVDDEPSGLTVHTAGSTEDVRTALAQAGATMFPEGIVAGVTGVLLNLGRRDQFPVAAILSQAHQGEPDARSAAAVVDVLAKLTDQAIDTARLLGEAEAFDAQIDDVERRRRLQDGQAGDSESLMFG